MLIWTVSALLAVLLFFIQISAIKERGGMPKADLFPADMEEGRERIERIMKVSKEKEEDLWGGVDEKKEEKLKQLIEEEMDNEEKNG